MAEYHPVPVTEWAAIRSMAEKIGCSPETLWPRVRRTERDAGHRPGLMTDARDRAVTETSAGNERTPLA